MPSEAAQKPLRGGRQRSDTISTHRVELGVWERERLKRYEQVVLWGTLVPVGVGVAAVGTGVGLAAWAFYKWAETVTGFVDDTLPKVANVAGWVFRKTTPVGIVWDMYEQSKEFL